MDVETYLQNFVNKSESICDLLKLFCHRLDCEIATLFVKTEEELRCIKHFNAIVSTCCTSTAPTLDLQWIENIQLGSTQPTFYKCETEIMNYMLVPVFIVQEVIGALVLANAKSPLLPESIGKQETAMISIIQLILSKEKVVYEAKQVFADDNYFSKDLFLANMSHEIKTPLHGIVGYCQLLEQTSLDSSQRLYIHHMSQCGLQLMRIINDVLDFSKLASGTMPVQSDCFRFNNLLEEIEHAVKRELVAKKQSLVFDNHPDIPDWVVIDKQKMIQILVNLLVNSSKFSHIGSTVKVVSCKKKIRKQLYLKIDVIDEGIGIAESDLCKLFNSFVQIKKSITKVGTGLGLAICKKLTELMRGTLDVESQLGIGSTFTLLVPYVPYEEYEKIVSTNMGMLINKCILLVDDTMENRLNIGDMLFDWDTKPVPCSSGEEAMGYINDNRYHFDAALVDICMPDMTGVELSERIKKIRPNLPIIALSSVNEYIDTSNFEHTLDKPFLKSHLLNALYTVLGGDDNSKLELSNPIRQRSKENLGIKGISVLVAEDVSYNRTLLVNMLNLMKYDNISEADDGIEAIKILTEHSFDVVLLDLRMPKVDGYGVLEYMDKNGMLENTTVVAVTASVMETDREQCQKSNVSFFLQKPIQLGDLQHIMSRISQLSPSSTPEL
jgi:two-component system sensor histidine kinase/response regulator